ncbi:hypothetical protein [robinz microvirus RP_71]|nr:hypothetical protein [robinz microvirus RP_71]
MKIRRWNPIIRAHFAVTPPTLEDKILYWWARIKNALL